MIAYEAFANPASTRKSMCDSTRLDTIELILINLSNYQTCHDCTIMLLHRPGEQDYSTYPNTSLRDAFRVCNSLPGTYGRRHTVQWFHRGNRSVDSRPHAFILDVCEWVSVFRCECGGVRGVWGCEYSRDVCEWVSVFRCERERRERCVRVWIQQRRVWVSLCVQMWMWAAWEVCEGVNTAELRSDSSQQWCCSI